MHAFVQQLDNNLKNLRAASKQFQDELVLERISKTPVETQNVFQPGDFVLFERDKDVPRPNKLSPDFMGPFEVVSQSKNDVQCRNLVYGNIKPLHVTRLKPFIGSREEAYELAKKDTDQFEVDCILAYRGDPETRTTMEFLVRFMDGDQTWLPYSQDIFQMQQFENFVWRPRVYTSCSIVFQYRARESRTSILSQSRCWDLVIASMSTFVRLENCGIKL